MPSVSTLYAVYNFLHSSFFYLIKTCEKIYSTVQFSELRILKQGTVLHGGDGNLKTHSNLLLGNTSSNPGPTSV